MKRVDNWYLSLRTLSGMMTLVLGKWTESRLYSQYFLCIQVFSLMSSTSKLSVQAQLTLHFQEFLTVCGNVLDLRSERPASWNHWSLWLIPSSSSDSEGPVRNPIYTQKIDDTFLMWFVILLINKVMPYYNRRSCYHEPLTVSIVSWANLTYFHTEFNDVSVNTLHDREEIPKILVLCIYISAARWLTCRTENN